MSEQVNAKELFESFRHSIKVTADMVKASRLTIHPEAKDAGEIIANITLAYRHLEDASMRLGKAIQAYDGGASVYDKSKVVGA